MRILITTILAALLATAAHAQNGDAVRIAWGCLGFCITAFTIVAENMQADHRR
jgi:hypothetical protein